MNATGDARLIIHFYVSVYMYKGKARSKHMYELILKELQTDTFHNIVKSLQMFKTVVLKIVFMFYKGLGERIGDARQCSYRFYTLLRLYTEGLSLADILKSF